MTTTLNMLERLRQLLDNADSSRQLSGETGRIGVGVGVEINQIFEGLFASLREEAESLEMSERRIRTLIQALPAGLLITNESGLIVAANPAVVDLFHCEYVDLEHCNLSEFFYAEGAPLTFSVQSLQSETIKPYEAMVKRPNGEEFPAQIKVCLFSAPASPMLLVVVEDVTARREMERLKEEFLSMVSHDLKAPLTSIQCFLDMLGAGRYADNPERAMQQARVVEADASRLIKMVNTLLEMHKLDSGRLEMFFDVVECAQIVNQAVQSAEALAETRQVVLSMEPIERNILVLADSDYLMQVLVNLISNAIKFSPKGKSIDIKVEATETTVTFKVIDQGPGIEEQFRKRMFNRFEQAQISDSRIKGGSGLGLAISKAIVQQHGGRIGVDSEAGSGSTFWFALPRKYV